MTDFDGRTVLITGAAGGIGQELCRTFAARGASIAALDRASTIQTFAEELCRNGHRASGAVADIGAPEQLEPALARLRHALGPIDIVVNNAGVSSASTLEQTTPESWRDDLNSNLHGAYNCVRTCLDDLKAHGRGVVINIGSVNGLSALGDPAYSAAKAAMISFTQSLALEYGRFGIRANIVCPGTVRTPIWDHRIERDPQVLERLVRWYPLQRVAVPADIARAVAFLASDDAAAITGAMLPVDCGLSAGNIVMSRELTLEEF